MYVFKLKICSYKDGKALCKYTLLCIIKLFISSFFVLVSLFTHSLCSSFLSWLCTFYRLPYRKISITHI